MPETLPPARVLVSDFDGTIAREDCDQVFLRHAWPSVADAVWDDYCAGRVTHFDALRLIFGSAAPGENALAAYTREMDLDPDLAAGVSQLRAAGGNWSLCRPGAAGTSTGCSRRLGFTSSCTPTPAG